MLHSVDWLGLFMAQSEQLVPFIKAVAVYEQCRVFVAQTLDGQREDCEFEFDKKRMGFESRTAPLSLHALPLSPSECLESRLSGLGSLKLLLLRMVSTSLQNESRHSLSGCSVWGHRSEVA